MVLVEHLIGTAFVCVCVCSNEITAAQTYGGSTLPDKVQRSEFTVTWWKMFVFPLWTQAIDWKMRAKLEVMATWLKGKSIPQLKNGRGNNQAKIHSWLKRLLKWSVLPRVREFFIVSVCKQAQYNTSCVHCDRLTTPSEGSVAYYKMAPLAQDRVPAYSPQ